MQRTRESMKFKIDDTKTDDNCKIVVTLSGRDHNKMTDLATKHNLKISTIARQMIVHCINELEGR